jgi:hypothetical protein
VHNLYIHELVKLRQAEMEERAKQARLVGLAVRARRSLRRASAQAPALSPDTYPTATRQSLTNRAELRSAAPTSR